MQSSNNIYSLYVSSSQVTQVQVTSLKIHSGNGGINRPVFNLRD